MIEGRQDRTALLRRSELRVYATDLLILFMHFADSLFFFRWQIAKSRYECACVNVCICVCFTLDQAHWQRNRDKFFDAACMHDLCSPRHIDTNIHIYTYIHTYMHTYIHTVSKKHVCMHDIFLPRHHTYTHTWLQRVQSSACKQCHKCVSQGSLCKVSKQCLIP